MLLLYNPHFYTFVLFIVWVFFQWFRIAIAAEGKTCTVNAPFHQVVVYHFSTVDGKGIAVINGAYTGSSCFHYYFLYIKINGIPLLDNTRLVAFDRDAAYMPF